MIILHAYFQGKDYQTYFTNTCAGEELAVKLAAIIESEPGWSVKLEFCIC